MLHGLRGKGFLGHLWIYGLCLAVVVPAMLLVSAQPDFGTYYPFYKLSSRSWFDFICWESIYFCQFFALEMFFRGWILGALRRNFGAGAVFAMAVPYCMIHYGKPLPETSQVHMLVTVPGKAQPLSLVGKVSHTILAADEEPPGMGIVFDLDDAQREQLLEVMKELEAQLRAPASDASATMRAAYRTLLASYDEVVEQEAYRCEEHRNYLVARIDLTDDFQLAAAITQCCCSAGSRRGSRPRWTSRAASSTGSSPRRSRAWRSCSAAWSPPR